MVKVLLKSENNNSAFIKTAFSDGKAALAEGISTTKMSRHIKNKIIIGDYYYSTV